MELALGREVLLKLGYPFYSLTRYERDQLLPVSSRSNTSFPFRKYRPDFTPYAPHKSMYDPGNKVADGNATICNYLTQ